MADTPKQSGVLDKLDPGSFEEPKILATLRKVPSGDAVSSSMVRLADRRTPSRRTAMRLDHGVTSVDECFGFSELADEVVRTQEQW